MNRCDEIRTQIVLYLDDELGREEKLLLESHLSGCTACRDAYEKERRLIEGVRAARPLYRTPPGLRASVGKALNAAEIAVSANAVKRRSGRRIPAMTGTMLSRLVPTRYAAVGLGAIIIALAGLWAVIETERRAPSEFARIAVASHQRHLRGQLPLEIVTKVPEEISAWFEGKVPFRLQLPNYQEASDQVPLYQLEGARLVGFKGDYAAFIAYRMETRPISLLVSSSMEATPAGGRAIALKGLVFHTETIAGLKVISWSHRDLTYALVSDLDERGQESCVVCHQGTQDRMEYLRPGS